jgi:hypothetical protein
MNNILTKKGRAATLYRPVYGERRINMLIKAGVDISRLRPEIRKKLNKISSIVWACDKKELVITSTYEGTHSEGSLHYANLAIDIRCGEALSEAGIEIARHLGKDYDVIMKAGHIHIEYDPKPRKTPKEPFI